MARRTKPRSARRRGASRAGSGSPPTAWFLGGMVLGLGIAAFLFVSGFIPVPSRTDANESPPVTASEPELLDDAGVAADGAATRYDFFTVLPEMEVVVPERELAGRPGTADQAPVDDAPGAYILQAGSFRSASDADQMKARLALQGVSATIQRVTVNDETWHRVRIGPVQGARAADELRRKLQDDDFDVLVLKVSG